MEKNKNPEVAVLISNNIDFKTKAIVRDKEGYYIMIKGTRQQEDVTPVNIYIPNIGATKYVKQLLMDIKGENDRSTLTVGDFNTPLTSMGRSSRQKNQQGDRCLNDTLD